MLMKIALKQMHFEAFVGIFEEEKISKNNILVDIEMLVDVQEKAFIEDNIEGTVDYYTCYNMTKSIFDKPINLLENAAYTIAKRVKNIDLNIHQITVTVSKLKPSLNGSVEASSVECTL